MRLAGCVAVAVMSLLLPSAPAYADLITLNATDQGWYKGDGVHVPGNDGYSAGFCPPCTFSEHEYPAFSSSTCRVYRAQSRPPHSGSSQGNSSHLT